MHQSKLLACLLLIGTYLPTSGQAQAPDAPEVISSDQLEANLQRSIEKGGWSEESIALVKAVWEDFAAMLEQNPTLGEARSLGSLGLPNPKSVETYVGRFGNKGSPEAFLEVKQVDGKLAVITRGHQIPAIIYNNSVYFTIGEVSKSPLPSTAGKAHGMLELHAIVFVNERYFIISTAGTSPPVEITKL